MRCIQQLRLATAPADRGALIREWVRLHDGVAKPPQPYGANDQVIKLLTSRFGVHGKDPLSDLLLLDADLNEVYSDHCISSLRLDANCRRPTSREVGDAVLIRLSEHREYNNITQKAAIRAILSMPAGATLIVSIPTGGGKSLVFQIGTLWGREQTVTKPLSSALVIVPTIALALDHERSARKVRGLEEARALTGSLNDSEKLDIQREFASGKIPLLFCSPEILFGKARDFFFQCCQADGDRLSIFKTRLDAVFVDEAHVIESWGRRFRPDFQRLPALLARLRTFNPDLKTILLSATLGDQALSHLRKAFSSSNLLEIAAKIPRSEFDIHFQKFSEDLRDDRVLELVDRLPRPAILYTTLVQHAETLFNRLRERGYERIALFTGNTSDAVRHRIVRDWSQDELDLVVATSAFGMGVDKANVRAVVHACVPENAARYYQEIGRAGRDGFQAFCFCAWTDSDVRKVRQQINSEWLTATVAEERWQALLCEAERCKGLNFDTGVLRLPLHARPERLAHRVTGEQNKEWNTALLTFLQRMEILEVRLEEGVIGEADAWTVEVKNFDFVQDPKVRSAVFARREEERQFALTELQSFVEILDSTQPFCSLCSLYELVEAGQPLAEPCGRCSVCRSERMTPSVSLQYKGGTRLWRQQAASQARRLLIHPEDPDFQNGLERLLQRLLQQGVDQFAVPDGIAQTVAESLAREPCCKLGLVTGLSNLCKGHWKLSPYLPTALLIPNLKLPGRDLLLKEVYETLERVILVASPAQQWNGKPMIQAMTVPAYWESYLDTSKGVLA